MSNNYYDMSGVLMLKKTTPVIRALFGHLHLDQRKVEGSGEVYIADLAEDTDTTWEAVQENMVKLIDELELDHPEPDENGTPAIDDYLEVLSQHYGTSDALAELMDRDIPFETSDNATLDSLLIIAQTFDDGHGLKGFKTGAAWYGDRPDLYTFGGSGEYVGEHYSVYGASNRVRILGEEVDTSLAAGNINDVSKLLFSRISGMVDGIKSEEHRIAVTKSLIAKLNANLPESMSTQ